MLSVLEIKQRTCHSEKRDADSRYDCLHFVKGNHQTAEEDECDPPIDQHHIFHPRALERINCIWDLEKKVRGEDNEHPEPRVDEPPLVKLLDVIFADHVPLLSLSLGDPFVPEVLNRVPLEG